MLLLHSQNLDIRAEVPIAVFHWAIGHGERGGMTHNLSYSGGRDRRSTKPDWETQQASLSKFIHKKRAEAVA